MQQPLMVNESIYLQNLLAWQAVEILLMQSSIDRSLKRFVACFPPVLAFRTRLSEFQQPARGYERRSLGLTVVVR